MASTTHEATTSKRNVSSLVLSPLLERLDEESWKKIEPFISEIEEQVVRKIEVIPEEKIKRKSRIGLTSAAIYDTFLLYEHQTMIKIRTEFIAESFGILNSAVNTTWLRLFDNRVKLDVGRIECLNWKGKDPRRLVNAVIDSLQGAMKEKPSGFLDWFASVARDAKNRIHLLDRELVKAYPPDFVATVAVYDVIKSQGKPMVPLSQKEAALVCSISPQMISKVWYELFRKGSISSAE